MQDPLKQGLKLLFLYLSSLFFTIRMQDPLKQGLKHFIPGLVAAAHSFECKIH